MIYILNYRGKSLISKLIKLATWGEFSHTALCTKQGHTIEAWHIGGVDKAPSPWHNHTTGTEVTVYGLKLSPVSAKRIWNEADNLVGSKYDFRALLGFIPGVRWLWGDNPQHWFCSHLVAVACKRGGAPLFSPQTKLYKISPALVDTSAELTRLGVVRDMIEFKDLVG